MGTPTLVDSDELAELRDEAQFGKDVVSAWKDVDGLHGMLAAIERMQTALLAFASRSIVREAAKKARATC